MDDTPRRDSRRDTTKGDTTGEPVTDNTLKHCGQWLTATLLVRADWKNLTIAGLLAGETILLATTTVIAIILLFSQEGPIIDRCIIMWKYIHPWLPLVVLGALLSMIAAHLAQWAEQRFSHGRGQLAAALALVPVAPIVFAVFLTPPLFAIAPLLSVFTLWALGKCWWSIFIPCLCRLTDWDYMTILNEANPPSPKVDWLSEHRQYLDTKRTALIERKQRLEHMDNPDSTSATLSPLWPEKVVTYPRIGHRMLWVAAMLIVLVMGGLGLAKVRNQSLNSSQPTTMPESAQASLTFWYQLDELEVSVLKELVKAYIDAGTPVDDINQIGDFPLLVQRAFLVGDPPDVMLLPRDLAYQLQAVWGNRLAKTSQDELDQLYFPLWPEHPWRQRLFLVISPQTKHPDLAQDFAAYLSSQLQGESDFRP